jgi:hypothetical protein
MASNVPFFNPLSANLITLSKGLTGEPDIRKFDTSELNAEIDAAIKSIPAGKTVAAFARVDMTGARLTIAGKVPGKIPGELDWTVYVDKPWDGDFDAGLGLRWSI